MAPKSEGKNVEYRSRARAEMTSLSSAFVLDTDVLLDYLYDDARATSYLESLGGLLMVSAVTVTELFMGVREGPERDALERFLSAFEIVDIDLAIASLAGLYRRDYARKYHTTVADALVAATAKSRKATLVTLNSERYPMLKKVIVPYSDHA